MAAAAGDFEALGAMLLAAEAAAGAAEAFTRAGDPRAATVTHTRALGARHTGYGVRATHYQTLGDALLAALAAILGDTFDAPTRQAWTLAYNLVAETMLEGAAAARPGPSAADRRPETGQRKRLILADVLDQPERALHPQRQSPRRQTPTRQCDLPLEGWRRPGRRPGSGLLIRSGAAS